ncbi:MAG: hypothetical protein AAFU64_02285 [Bacteroidota bacterium]
MSQKFIVFRRYFNSQQADYVIDVLKYHQVPYQFSQEKQASILGESIVGSFPGPAWLLKVPRHLLPEVETLLEKDLIQHISEDSLEGHYLSGQDDLDLIQMFKEPEKWSIEERAIAQKLLAQRGIPLDPQYIEQKKQERNALLRRGKKAHLFQTLFLLALVFWAGMVLNVFIFLVGMAMGWYYWKDQSRDASAQPYFTFEKRTRQWGLLILLTGFIALLIGLFFWVKKPSQKEMPL